ncbi:MucB/RseB C-terminal domain-containing protein [Psychromonas antarctica]|jgi:sigma-E factor negative regulatory protein RseB|uniref:MucB/RseB C-terminal domain-containing protein n=1 Tax=Psychromonas antarctica TaxID=67573 RepID=UPI001EE7DE05|nr:MucB/RseB C-terminal domain-containing protein [Psychromonas antarctica]MCG6201491.1 MucB/RseB C-terminal domain-containing protein [Psychromonas antarctica]
MKLKILFSTLIAIVVVMTSGSTFAIETDGMNQASESYIAKKETLTAIEYLQFMQKSYKELNYELLYLNSLQSQVEPKQLIHGVVDDQEIAYFRFLNGAMRESLQYSGKISYFEQGTQAYTLESTLNRSVFANIANFDYEKGQDSYEYIILGKGRIAGKQAIAIRMISKDEYRYSYIVWLDVDSYLPLRLDTLNKSNLILDQVMVVSLLISEKVSPWLDKLSKQQLPQLLNLPQASQKEKSEWAINWLPTGFNVVRNDQHKLVMHNNEPVSYIMLNDGIVSVSIYISAKKITLDEKQKVIQRGATVLYTYQKGDIEINIIGDIPVVTAKRLIESISKVK